MAVLEQALYVDRGVDYPDLVDPTEYVWESPEGTLVDLTGYTATMKVREREGSTVLLTLTRGAGITLGGTAGTIRISISAAQSSAIAAGSYRYDLVLTSGSGRTYKFLAGPITFKPTMSS